MSKFEGIREDRGADDGVNISFCFPISEWGEYTSKLTPNSKSEKLYPFCHMERGYYDNKHILFCMRVVDITVYSILCVSKSL